MATPAAYAYTAPMHLRTSLFLAVLALFAAIAAPAAAAPAISGQFEVSTLESNNKLVADPDGGIWVTVASATKDVARVDATSGEVKEFDLGLNGALGITVGPDKKIWVTSAGAVTSFSPADPEASKDTTPIAAVAGTHSIVTGPDGNLWIAASENLVLVPPAKPAEFKAFAFPGMGPRDIDVSGSSLAIADFGKSRVLFASTEGKSTNNLVLAGGPQGVAGNAAGLTAYSQPSEEPKGIAILVSPVQILEKQFPGADPFGVDLGPDGAFWFAESNQKRLLRMATDGSVTELTGLEGSPRQIATGPGNTLWVTEEGVNKVARVSGVGADTGGGGGGGGGNPPPQTAPRTNLGKGPRATVPTRAKRAAVSLRFSSPDAGSSFQCRLLRVAPKGARRKPKVPAFAACKSPRSYRVGRGNYRFEVRAVLSGVVDPSPAVRRFKVIRVFAARR